MKKLLVLGASKNRKLILEKLQEIGVVHVVPASAKEIKSQMDNVEEQEQLLNAISILSSFKNEDPDATSLPENIIHDIISWHNSIQKYREENDDLS